MSVEEAIKILEKEIEILGKNLLTGRLKEKIENIISSKKKAIVALEKQIPKNPSFEGDGYFDGKLVYDTWICPNCGEKYEVEFEEHDFCPNCGQAIDWSDKA